ncbi:ribosome biogenesis GTPase Der [Crassaminicella thermophila]|uniref:GTPase Der n=1 Tax=Crassaminicella thermophila TaxID=2599308 RepID=A0A5C0SF88_CRATE|nr:ribosome biogenesis GTPase Der [Crassaminicella thermophila]QEK11974.1 ribosome biogenesis GTPase Der [Crassaminicella thermophila]
MAKPVVAIVGRPNVGKSTFFNKLAGKRIAIVEDKPGVTRDRIYADVEWLNYNFTLIDTGGLEPESKDIILSQMRAQAKIAIETADVIVFMVDGRTGLVAADEEIANLLRKTGKPVLLVVNKVDTSKLPDSFYDFYQLALGDPVPISSTNALGLGDLLDEIVKRFPKNDVEEYEDEAIKVAVIGKPNVGKSSIINTILGEERVIVSDIAGTTRDAIDTPFVHGNDKYVFIDTAGIRRKSRVVEDIEKYSVVRSLGAIDRANVCIMMIDATEGVTEQDKKIAGYAHEAGKATVIVVNKWDAVKKETNTMNEYVKEIRNQLSFMSYAPILFVSAVTKQRVHKILETVKFISNQHSMRVPTGRLNDVINEAILLNQPPSDKGKRLKIYYVTQISVRPPVFVIFVNDRELTHFSYTRYIENKIREAFGFEGTPISILYREKGEEI